MSVVRLRGHHLICMLGFRGMGYSERFTQNMNEVYERLRRSPGTSVEIVEGADDLCAKFPCNQEYHCDKRSVHEHDERITQHLGIQTGERLTWSELLQLVRDRVQPEHIPVWCASCRWVSYGVCKAGVERVQNGMPLPPITDWHS